jgi:putative photosynthetic complex assembly protein 2
MLLYGLPIVFALFAWWFSTGAILYLDRLPRWTFRWTILGATVILAASFALLAAVRADTSIAGAYLGFLAALGVWAWNEVAFLMGFVTGSRRTACPAALTGWPRFKWGLQTVLHHELAIIGAGAGIALLTAGSPNQVALWTYGVLWIMRLSTKLNIFLGVPNAPTAFLPDHLAYMAGCFRNSPMNPLFPLSITFGTGAGVILALKALHPEASAFDAVAFSLVGTLLALAILEHWFLVLPLPSEKLWGWGMRKSEPLPVAVRIHQPGTSSRARENDQRLVVETPLDGFIIPTFGKAKA